MAIRAMLLGNRRKINGCRSSFSLSLTLGFIDGSIDSLGELGFVETYISASEKKPVQPKENANPGYSALAVRSQTPCALYNPYLVGARRYKFRVLSQGYLDFSFDEMGECGAKITLVVRWRKRWIHWTCFKVTPNLKPKVLSFSGHLFKSIRGISRV